VKKIYKMVPRQQKMKKVVGIEGDPVENPVEKTK
jgi:hypothetical protein